MDTDQISKNLEEVKNHLTNELLPFWFDRCMDNKHGGFITHFDENGNDTGEDEKSLIAQARCTYTFASAHRAGWGDEKCLEYAEHGIDYLIDKMWDKEYGGFYWMTERTGNVVNDQKILYGQSFAIYALAEYTLATGDPVGMEFASDLFDIIQVQAADLMYGGYFEMFDRSWNLCGPGPAGGDRKTLDVHMHLMEAYTTLYEASGLEIHRRKLLEIIDILMKRILHQVHRTGIPQFTPDWQIAPQIKFDIIWGWDRFTDGQVKDNATDNTAYGHNTEFAWLLNHALDILELSKSQYLETMKKALDHAIDYGLDNEFGGVFVEGPHDGPATDLEKEFWQQCEAMIGFLDGKILFGDERYLEAYNNVHRFVFDKVINYEVGEWWPLLNRQGDPIWTHMSHSWKINYHTVRAMIQSAKRLERLLNE